MSEKKDKKTVKSKKKKKAKTIKVGAFDKLSVQECHLIYPALLENAERHVKAAIAISEIKEYGIANAHLIMAADEYVKALSVYLAGWGLPVARIKTLTNYFAEQEEGYAVSPGVVIMGNFIRTLYTVFDQFSKSITQLSPSELTKIFSKDLSPISMVKKSTQYVDWWQQSKVRKDNGLYVTYNVELATPKDITAKDYAFSLTMIKDIHENCFGVIEFTKKIPKKRREQFFNWIKNYFEPFIQRLNKFPFNWKL